MEPSTLALIGAYALGKADKFLDVFIEGKGQDLYEKWKARNAAETCKEADLMLQEAGRIVLGPVPGRLIMPILEAASQDDDPEMRKMWAALLANTASMGGEKQLPGFSDTLRQLTPTHARILQWLYDQAYDPGTGIKHWPTVERKAIETYFDLSGANYALLMADMTRLQLIQRHRPHKNLDDKHSAQQQINHLLAELNERDRLDHITLSTLGIHFMMAVTPPTKDQ